MLGKGVEHSYDKAVEYYTMAAEQGDANAQFNLGFMFGNGLGVEQSYEKAVEYCTMAAEQGHANAQCELGLMYENGQGVEQSCAIARKWWAKAANQGQEDAIKLLKAPEKIERTTTTLSSRCSACGKPKSKYQKLRKCSGCHAVQYCNTECQKKHWKIGGHKKEFKKLKQQQQNTK
jgi:TPR repeat protein